MTFQRGVKQSDKIGSRMEVYMPCLKINPQKVIKSKRSSGEEDIIGSSSQSAVMWYLVTCECVRRRGL